MRVPTQNKGYISKKEKGTGIYQNLFQEGVAILQELSSKHWTDYNEHDPGVTILENIVYTLTNLLHKAHFPIEDILVESKGKAIESGDNAMFLPSEILTTNPVTLEDFSKVVMDSVHNVKNVWTYPTEAPEGSMSGWYRIEIEPYEYPSEDHPEFDKKIGSLPERVEAIFHKHRNLCENIAEVKVLKPLVLKVEMTLSLKEEVNGEKVLANVFYDLQSHLSKTIDFFSLDYLMKSDQDINTIFNGPFLKHGFVPNSQLEKRMDSINTRELMRLITDSKLNGISGLQSNVIAIDLFNVYQQSENNEWILIKEQNFKVPADNFPSLQLVNDPTMLRFKQAEIEYKADLVEVKKQIAYREGQEFGNFRSVSQSAKTVSIPQGINKNVNSYYSIREQFPQIYGIGAYGLSGDVTMNRKSSAQKRKAQANQLMGYLLPFDQIMANFLSQLSGIHDLFKVSNAKNQSYFFKELDDMDRLAPLIQKEFGEKKTLKLWNRTLTELNAQFDTSNIDRLSKVSDHLLARFNEEFSKYILRNINTKSYGKDLTEEGFEKELLYLKRKFAANYPDLSYNRAKSYNLWGNTKYVPRLVEKVAILLGIKNLSFRRLYKVVDDAGISIQEDDALSTKLMHQKEDLFVQEEMDIEIFEAIETLQQEEENLQNTLYFSGPPEEVLNEVLENGILENSYRIKEAPSQSNKRFYLEFTPSSKQNESELIHIAETIDEAERARDNMIKKLRKVSRDSEGVYLLEHMLLAPAVGASQFGFSFELEIENNDCLIFEQRTLLTYKERNLLVQEILGHLVEEELPSFSYHRDGLDFKIDLLKNDREIVASAISDVRTEQEVKEKVELLNKSLCGLWLGAKISNTQYLAYYNELSINETFFSFQMSFVLPSWPVRMQRGKFKAQFLRLMQENAPAHIAFYTYWMDYSEMVIFEDLYHRWMSLTPSDKPSQERQDLSYQLITLLQEFHRRKYGKN